MKRAKFLFITILFSTVVALIVSINPTAAQTPAPTPTVTATPIPTPSPTPVLNPTPPSTLTPTSDVRVIDVYKSGHQEEKNLEIRNSAGIGDIIVIKVRSLQSLVDQAKCLDQDNNAVQNCQKQEIALFLDGRKNNGIVSISSSPRPEDETLQFRLQRKADNSEAWADLLGAPPFLNSKFFKRPTQVSVGLENGYAEPTDVIGEKFKLVRIREGLFWFCFVFLVGLLIGILVLAYKSDLLRDLGPKPDLLNRKRKPFSLARCQMAWWFFWVISSFVFIWQITGAYEIITPSTLGLIGISASTALGAAAIDVTKREESNTQLSSLDSLEAERQILVNDMEELGKQTLPPVELDKLQQKWVVEKERLVILDNQITTLRDLGQDRQKLETDIAKLNYELKATRKILQPEKVKKQTSLDSVNNQITQLRDLETERQTLRNNIAVLDQQISPLPELSRLQEQRAKKQFQLADVNNQITLQTERGTQQTWLNFLKKKIKALSAASPRRALSLEAEKQQLKNKIIELDSQINAKLNELQPGRENIQTRLGSVEAQIKALLAANPSGLLGLEAQRLQLETDITKLDSQINAKLNELQPARETRLTQLDAVNRKIEPFRAENPQELQHLEAQRLQLEKDIAKLDSQISAKLNILQPERVTKLTQIDAVNRKIEALRSVAKPQESETWWKDIITDANGGMSFHRLQIFVWTLVLGLLFISSVWSRLSMPGFDPTLLALQGFSGLTYLGFKFPE